MGACERFVEFDTKDIRLVVSYFEIVNRVNFALREIKSVEVGEEAILKTIFEHGLDAQFTVRYGMSTKSRLVEKCRQILLDNASSGHNSWATLDEARRVFRDMVLSS